MNSNYFLQEPQKKMQSDVSTKLLMRHLNSFVDNDLQTLMSDYTDQSVLITRDATFNGLNEIKDFFTYLMIHFPKTGSTFELEKMVVNDELGFIVWNASTPTLIVSLGTDTFIFKDEKIFQQTFAGMLNFFN